MRKNAMFSLIYLIMVCVHTSLFVSATIANRGQDMCREFSDMYMKQCSSRISPRITPTPPMRGFPGKRGGRGDLGPRGPPGPQGIVDYKKVKQQIGEVNLELEAKFNETLAQLDEKLSSRILELETALKNSKTENGCGVDDEDCNSSGSGDDSVLGCELKYRSKCFKVVLRTVRNVYVNEARQMCDNGWKLANIYSKAHYDSVANLIRPRISSSFTSVWTGMTYDNRMNRIILGDGTFFQGTPPWRTSHPRTLGNVGLEIRKFQYSSSQGLVIFPNYYYAHGAVCET